VTHVGTNVYENPRVVRGVSKTQGILWVGEEPVEARFFWLVRVPGEDSFLLAR
jgi:hypothetical protein